MPDPALGVQQREPRRVEVPDDPLALVVPAEEVLGVLLAEVAQPGVRARRHCALHRRVDLGDGHDTAVALQDAVIAAWRPSRYVAISTSYMSTPKSSHNSSSTSSASSTIDHDLAPSF